MTKASFKLFFSLRQNDPFTTLDKTAWSHKLTPKYPILSRAGQLCTQIVVLLSAIILRHLTAGFAVAVTSPIRRQLTWPHVGNTHNQRPSARAHVWRVVISHITRHARMAGRKADVVAALDIPADFKKVIETSVNQGWAIASKLAPVTVETVRKKSDVANRGRHRRA